MLCTVQSETQTRYYNFLLFSCPCDYLLGIKTPLAMSALLDKKSSSLPLFHSSSQSAAPRSSSSSC